MSRKSLYLYRCVKVRFFQRNTFLRHFSIMCLVMGLVCLSVPFTHSALAKCLTTTTSKTSVGRPDRHTNTHDVDKKIIKSSDCRSSQQLLQPLRPIDTKCRDCHRGTSPVTDALRLEAIKQQILTKLGMAAPPNVTITLPKQFAIETLFRAQEMPVDLRRTRHITNNPDDFYGRTQEIIEFADGGGSINGQQLLEFSTNQDQPVTQELRVRTATLWIRFDTIRRSRQRRRAENNSSNNNRQEITIWVFQLLENPQNNTKVSILQGQEFDRIARMSATSRVSLHETGWQKVDLTGTVRRWFTQTLAKPLRLLVDCSGCRGRALVHPFGRLSREYAVDSHRPFLVLHTDPNVMRRVRRRALDCSGAIRGQCCKQRFYVSFKALGWDDWIIAPHGYFANYCRGDCGGIRRTPDTFLTYYTHIIDEFRKMNKLTAMQPCCAPLKFSSMSLIYFGPEQKIIKRDLPKMVVDECGCP
ncbi:Inhibin beta chain [Sergentomyia squamirostris]